MGGRRSEAIGRWAVRTYPAAWRQRYASEVLAVLDDRPPGWRDTADLARGALDAYLHPARPSRFVAIAAVTAGAAWTVVALAALLEPAVPDWPGYLAWSLLPAVVGAIAGLAASAGLALRLGPIGGRLARLAVAVAILGQLALVTTLAIAAAGGPYGAITGAAGSLAGVGLVLQGTATVRASRAPDGIGLVLVGGGLLIPPPLAWVVIATTWTVLGVWLVVDTATARQGPVGPGAVT